MKRRETNVFSIAFLDLLSGALGAVIILFVAVPKATNQDPKIKEVKAKEGFAREIRKETKIDKKSDYTARFNEKEEMEEHTAQLSKLLDDLKEKNDQLNSDKEELEAKAASMQNQIEEMKKDSRDRKTASIPVDVGFRFKGKSIVLVIDVSGSMFLEDKIGQVKAGLKMLITSMGEEFNIDVVHFPDGMTQDYRTLWGRTKTMDKSNKSTVLQDLKPWGATPTRSVMKYVLKNYENATDIVLLSDGAPTVRNSKQMDDIYSVAKDIKQSNRREIQISTIGVGSDFLRDTGNPKYRFLKKVAEENNGFFVGF